MVRKDEDDKVFAVVVIDANGDKVAEVHLPFNFLEC